MFYEIYYRLQGYAQQPILWALADVLFRVLFAYLTNKTLFGIEKLFFWALLCAPSIYLVYAVINGKYGLAFIWPLANAIIWTISYHIMVLAFLLFVDHSGGHMHLLLLLAKAIFFLGYALVIAKYWKDNANQPQSQSAQNHGFDTSIITAEVV